MATTGSASVRVIAVLLILGALVTGGVAVWAWARSIRTPAQTAVTQLGAEVEPTWTEVAGDGPGGAWGLRGQSAWGLSGASVWNPVALAAATTVNRSGDPILEWNVRAQVADLPQASFRLICSGSCRENGFEVRPSFDPETARLDLTVTEVYPPAAPREMTLSFRWSPGRFDPWPNAASAEPETAK